MNKDHIPKTPEEKEKYSEVVEKSSYEDTDKDVPNKEDPILDGTGNTNPKSSKKITLNQLDGESKENNKFSWILVKEWCKKNGVIATLIGVIIIMFIRAVISNPKKIDLNKNDINHISKDIDEIKSDVDNIDEKIDKLNEKVLRNTYTKNNNQE